ncbi:sperm-specific sodium:proton exchanger-like isoform X2 [Ornithodoros turicata]|uniref:sperm-specific sodium:proton exchanger-like isoform X2 n=1 Tax=Ornithodoros turicata TaxID=34597 RepID=UPI003139B093
MADLGGEAGILLVLVVIMVSAMLRISKGVVNVPVLAVIASWGFFVGMAVNKYKVKEKFLAITDSHINEMLFLYMPVLTFAVSFNIRYHLFQQCFWQCCILGVVGVVVSCSLFVLYMHFMGIGSDHISMKTRVLVSLLICCPEPLFLKDMSFSSSGFSLSILTTTFVGPCFGKVVGHIMSYMLISFSQDLSITYLISICAVYLTYLAAEMFLYGSGVTSIVSLGVTAGAHSASTILDPIILRKFWALFRYTLNVVIVFLASFKVGRDSKDFIDLDDLNTIVHSYLAKIIVRGLMILILYPLICATGYDLTWKQCMIAFWVNFKGAVMLGISLSKWVTNIDVNFALKEEAIRLGVLFLVQAINTTTLPKLMWSLDLVQMSEADSANMRMVVTTLQNKAFASTNIQRREKKFSGADWKWIQTHTQIGNPYADVALSTTKTRFPRLALIRRRSDALITEAKRNANRNILRLQKVCYNKQYEDGMVQKTSKTTILAVMQYPLEKETYLTVNMMTPYITVPSWIYSLKDLLQRYAGMEAIERRSTRRISTRLNLEDTSYMDIDMVTASLAQGWYQVLMGFVAIGFTILLAGLFIYYQYRPSDMLLSIVTTVQGIYVVCYALEIFLIVYSVGMFHSRHDVWRQLDFIIFALVVAEFVLTSFVTVASDMNKNAGFLMMSFILLVTCRTIKTLQKRVVMYVWLWDMMDGLLNRRLFFAYDISWAYITAEDEAMARVNRYVHSVVVAKQVRDLCRKNKLEALKNVIDIQQKYPNIEVATKTRQAARRVLNKALEGLRQLHEGGLLEDRQYAMLFEDMTWTIHKVDVMPSDIAVGNTLLCILLSIPWLPNDVAPQVLQTFYQTQKRGHIVVFSGHDHEHISIICSGIVKVFARETAMGCNVDGLLENSDSNLYYFTEGTFKDYLVAPEALGILGFLTHAPSVCQAVCETDVQFCTVPMEVIERIVEHHPEPPTVIYRMWFSVAVRVGMAVLLNQKRYQDWTNDKLKRFLEGGIMPNLYYAAEFGLDEAVQDVILIQGCVTTTDGLQCYIGPSYIPDDVREMKLPGSPSTRPRPIMIITTLVRYHLPIELDWYHQPLRPFDYVPRPRTDNELYAHW